MYGSCRRQVQTLADVPRLLQVARKPDLGIALVEPENAAAFRKNLLRQA
jgi:hypothetical protein